MALTSGTRLGPYEILAPIGAGGMGELYRARDERLKREIAIKVLPASLSEDADRLRRFEQEAQAASALNHPNIVTVYDIGTADRTVYIAMELIEGKSLRDLIEEGPLPVKKIVAVASQVADGLAAAHAKQIVHRDLKPENIMVTRDGVAKVLDFGLAKLAAPLPTADDSEETQTRMTEPGTILGTIGYMSPEQATGKPVDPRSDQFSLGAILYELAAGRAAYKRQTAVDTLWAILHEEPEPLAKVNPAVPPPLRWIIERCLAKDPEDRFASTRDLAQDLLSVREHLSEISSAPGSAVERETTPRRRMWWLLAVAVPLVTLAAGLLVGRRLWERPLPRFHRLTFRRGYVSAARFAPDGQTVIYSAAWEGKLPELFLTRLESPESRSLGFKNSQLFGISATGEMAIRLGGAFEEETFGVSGGTLAFAPIAGGAARKSLQSITSADWAPDGKSLAILRITADQMQLEYPVGKKFYETPAHVTRIHVSPTGDQIAFIENLNGAAAVVVVDRRGAKRTISRGWRQAAGGYWSADGREIWFTASETGRPQTLYAVSLSGKLRMIFRAAGEILLQDVDRGGRALLLQENVQGGILGVPPGQTREREMSWLDYSELTAISNDGTQILFTESGEGGGAHRAVHLRGTDESPAVRLGEGRAMALSPDGKWALTLALAQPPHLVLLPTGVGEPKDLPAGGIADFQAASFLPDGRGILISGVQRGRGERLFAQDIATGQIRPVTPEGISNGPLVSPDGQRVVSSGSDFILSVYPLAGGKPAAIPGLADGFNPLAWSADGRSIYVDKGQVPDPVSRIDLSSGHAELWKQLVPADPAGVSRIDPVCIAPDGQSYAYGYQRVLSVLYLLEGLR